MVFNTVHTSAMPITESVDSYSTLLQGTLNGLDAPVSSEKVITEIRSNCYWSADRQINLHRVSLDSAITGFPKLTFTFCVNQLLDCLQP